MVHDILGCTVRNKGIKLNLSLLDCPAGGAATETLIEFVIC